MRLDSLHPGASAGRTSGPPWAGRCASPTTLTTTPPPSTEELRLIREVLDPQGRYTGS